jgi:hypothetical protein
MITTGLVSLESNYLTQDLQSESCESFKLIEKSIQRASYGTQIKRDFGAEPYQWNFAKDPQKAKNVVNAKVAKTSNGALKRFLEPGMAVQKCYFYYRVVSWGLVMVLWGACSKVLSRFRSRTLSMELCKISTKG